MLSPAKADALCTEVHSLLSISWVVRIGPYFESPDLICPSHDRSEVTGKLRRYGLDLALENIACSSVEGDVIAFFEHIRSDGQALARFIDLDL